METKIIAAEIATAAGVATIITSSKRPENIFDIIEYHNSKKPSPTSTPGTPREPLSGRTSPVLQHVTIPLQRPLHTMFMPSTSPITDLKSWTRHTLFPSGSVVIDRGAHRVLSRRESGGRLLAAGVIDVIGAFASGQAVRIVVRKQIGVEETPPQTRPASPSDDETKPAPIPEGDSDRVPDAPGELEVTEVGRGLANYNSAQISKVKGMNSSYLPQLLEYADSDYVVENITIQVPP